MAGGAAVSRLFVFGLGYSALALARRLQAEGWRIAGTTRSAGEAGEARRSGHRGPSVRPRPAARRTGRRARRRDPPPELDRAGRGGRPGARPSRADLERCRPLAWAGYLGTTGVYGDRGGDWVDEASPVAPTMARTRRRVAAEGRWLARAACRSTCSASPASTAGRAATRSTRCARGTARRDRQARPDVRPDPRRGHRADAVRLDRAAQSRRDLQRRRRRAGAAAGRDRLCAASCWACAPPPEIPFERGRAVADGAELLRRQPAHRNARIKQELGVRLRYPSYREGLRCPASRAGAERYPTL